MTDRDQVAIAELILNDDKDVSVFKDYKSIDQKMKSPPQDVPVLNANEISMTTGEGSPTGSSYIPKVRGWISLNKSNELTFSEGSTPEGDNSSVRTTPRDNKSPGHVSTKNEELSLDSRSEEDYVADFQLAGNGESPSLSIVGKRWESFNRYEQDDTLDSITTVQPLNFTHFSDPEVNVETSEKDWIKILYDGKETMLVLPNERSTIFGSTSGIAETLAASLNISDEIVGLSSTAILVDKESSPFKKHGNFVIPLSYIVSGQLKQIIQNSEPIPSFYLVTKKLPPIFDTNGDEVSSKLYLNHDELSNGEKSLGESFRYTETFIEVMENSNGFTALEKKALLRFGIYEAANGNVLYRAAFRVAVYLEDLSYFEKGLKGIALVLLDGNSLAAISDDDYGRSIDEKKSKKSLLSLIEFIESADDLLDGNDLTAEQYVTLVDAIYSDNSEVEKLFDLHCCSDFLLDSDFEDIRGALLMRDLLHLGKMLPSIESRLSDDVLKWAIHTGLHNFNSTLLTPLPQEFVNIVYHMFSSGDDIVLSACKKFVETCDSEVVESMIQREWDIYCRNREHQDSSVKVESKNIETKVDTATPVTELHIDKEVPDLLLTSLAALVDLKEITDEAASATIASFIKGSNLLNDVYEHFIQFGNTVDFLSNLKSIAVANDQCQSSEIPSSMLLMDENASFCDDTVHNFNESLYSAFKMALGCLKEENMFGAIEIAALRLAAVRKDAFLSNALLLYQETKDYSCFKRDLMNVVTRIIRETESSSDPVAIS